jgi:hypothetical protein
MSGKKKSLQDQVIKGDENNLDSTQQNNHKNQPGK